MRKPMPNKPVRGELKNIAKEEGRAWVAALIVFAVLTAVNRGWLPWPF